MAQTRKKKSHLRLAIFNQTCVESGEKNDIFLFFFGSMFIKIKRKSRKELLAKQKGKKKKKRKEKVCDPINKCVQFFWLFRILDFIL